MGNNAASHSTEGKISHSMDLVTPSSPGGLPTLSLTTNSSWLPWGRVVVPPISPPMPVHQLYGIQYTILTLYLLYVCQFAELIPFLKLDWQTLWHPEWSKTNPEQHQITSTHLTVDSILLDSALYSIKFNRSVRDKSPRTILPLTDDNEKKKHSEVMQTVCG